MSLHVGRLAWVGLLTILGANAIPQAWADPGSETEIASPAVDRQTDLDTEEERFQSWNLYSPYAMVSMVAAAKGITPAVSVGADFRWEKGFVALHISPLEFGILRNAQSNALLIRFLRLGAKGYIRPASKVSPFVGYSISFPMMLGTLNDKVVAGVGVDMGMSVGLEVPHRGSTRFHSALELMLPVGGVPSTDGVVRPVTVGMRMGVSFRSKRTAGETLEIWLRRLGR